MFGSPFGTNSMGFISSAPPAMTILVPWTQEFGHAYNQFLGMGNPNPFGGIPPFSGGLPFPGSVPAFGGAPFAMGVTTDYY